VIGLRVDCPETVCDDDEGEQGADKVYAEIKTLERFLSVMIGGEQKHVEEEVGCDGHQHGQDDRAHGRDGLVTMEPLVDQGWHVAVWCCKEIAFTANHKHAFIFGTDGQRGSWAEAHQQTRAPGWAKARVDGDWLSNTDVPHTQSLSHVYH
jgi:hypothetical protein